RRARGLLFFARRADVAQPDAVVSGGSARRAADRAVARFARAGGAAFDGGIRAETFSVEFPRVQPAALARAYPDFYQESAHNILLDALTAQGAIGLLALVAFVGLGFYAVWKAPLVPGGFFGAALAASLVSHQFSVFTMPTALYFYLTVGILV